MFEEDYDKVLLKELITLYCFIVHSKIGFGLMNAERLVDYAKTWSSVPRQEICTMQLHGKT